MDDKMSEYIPLFSSSSREVPSFFMLHARSNRAQNGPNVPVEYQRRLGKKVARRRQGKGLPRRRVGAYPSHAIILVYCSDVCQEQSLAESWGQEGGF